MSGSAIEVLGVHRLAITPELIDAALEQLHGYVPEGEDREELEPYCRELVESVVLVELIVRDKDDRFRVEDFTQRVPNRPASERQAAWLETYLSPDGAARIVQERYLAKVPKDRDLRMAFFMHFWEPTFPLSTSYGDVICPVVTDMPARLEQLAPYEAPS